MPFVRLDQLKEESVEWLWPGRLALGNLHMADGDPGLGKSLVLCDLIARATSGQAWPDGAPAGPPIAAVVLNAEDSARATVRARLLAAGAAPERVSVWDRDPGEPWPHLPGNLAALEELLERTGARFVVLDPLTAFLGPSVNVTSDPAVRQTLQPLSDLARRRRCAIVLLRHLNKELGGKALYRGLASIAFVASCRVAWLFGADPKIPRQFVLAQPKNNLDPPATSLSYTLTGNLEGVARVTWLGPTTWTHESLLGAGARVGSVDRACTFLTEFLKTSPQPVKTILAAGKAQDLSRTVLNRAARLLKMLHRRAGAFRSPVHYWLLPGQEMPPHLLTKEQRELEPFFRRLDEEAASVRSGQGAERPH